MSGSFTIDSIEQVAANLGVIKQCTLDEGKYAI
jgi:hypothetical protein